MIKQGMIKQGMIKQGMIKQGVMIAAKEKMVVGIRSVVL